MKFVTFALICVTAIGRRAADLPKVGMSFSQHNMEVRVQDSETSVPATLFQPPTVDINQYLWSVKYNFTRPCFEGAYFSDGPKVITDRDVDIWEDGEMGISAENSVECESYCLQFDTCECFIFDTSLSRCNLKRGCTGALDANKKSKGVYNSCFFRRPPIFMQCQFGLNDRPCLNGCTPRGLEPDCKCGAPGMLSPPAGFTGDYCEKKDECYKQVAGTVCEDGGSCEINKKGLMVCRAPCWQRKEGAECKRAEGTGICKFALRGRLQCQLNHCAAKNEGEVCPVAEGLTGKCQSINGTKTCAPCPEPK